jgi:serine/threonine-protein kinase
MALLLGEVTVQDLEDAWKDVPPGEPMDPETVLSRLPTQVRQGIDTQVLDLEVYLRVQEPTALEESPPLGRRNTPTAPYSVGTVPQGEGTQDLSDLPRDQFYFDPRQGLGRRILSNLTLPRWNQYTDLRFLGEGGMGRIFKAFDPTLRRYVALKFLRRVDPGRVTGLLEEARNQAQVNHPNICKVFEAKQWRGQLYVAMQFIEGRNLDVVAPELSENQKLEIMERVADAMHAAHRKGLIHRDLKPANIMVERTPEGFYVPYVLDFGLAFDLGRPGETLDGSIIGTTHYMAPEQARGELSLVGRRTDIYALGVTLYELLSGAPPFQAAGELECLRLVQEEEVPPLRGLVPGIHPDLDTIVMKCLEKDISRRYESARALAEDLKRFRDGEPILAHPATLGYRFGKWARKYRALVALGSAALVVAGSFGAFGLHAHLAASSQAQWAAHFGQEAERIEARVRYTRLLPRHDVRVEMAQILDRIKAMEAEVVQAGDRAKGPGSYALGRAYLALGDPGRARELLDRAWNAGFQVRDVSYARGRALGDLYARAFPKARAMQDAGLREARIRELEETLRDPAVALLRQGRGSTMEPGDYQEGLLAFYERRYDEALRAARESARVAPWFYESQALEAQVDLERGRLVEDPEMAAFYLRAAGEALAAASSTAPSDPALWDLHARRWLEEMVQRRRKGLSVRDEFQSLEEACRHWREIVPDAPGPDARLAWGEIERARSDDSEARDGAIERAIARARTVLQSSPDHSEALCALAAGLQLQGYAALNAGKDPRPTLDRAVQVLQRALKGDEAPFEVFEPFASVLWARVEYERTQGRDPSPAVAEALLSIRDLARRYPKVADFEGFLGGIQVELADFQALHGTDPGPVVRLALADLRLALGMAPARFDFHYSEGNAHLALAQYRVLEGSDAGGELEAAEAAYRTAREHNSTVAAPLSGLAEASLLRAQALSDQDHNPAAPLVQAESANHAAGRISDSWLISLLTSEIACLRARWSTDPQESLRLLAIAVQSAAEATRRSGGHPAALVASARAQAAWARRVPGEAPARLRQARRIIQDTLQKDPTFLPAARLAASLAGTRG